MAYNAAMSHPNPVADNTAQPAADRCEPPRHSPPDQTGDVSPQEIGPGPRYDLDLKVEALLMSTNHPQPSTKLAPLIGSVSAKQVDEAVKRLNQIYERTDRSFRVERVAAGWQIMTVPRFADLLAAAHKNKVATRLSPAAMEALAIIAYKQPIPRADIEAIRGVASGEVIRGLMERRLVKIVGRAEELGRPMLYGTTRSFLEVFGLVSLKDLPKVEDLWHKT